ncbi:hypothetical protein ACN47E_006013 [Coniothyrium glycines]
MSLLRTLDRTSAVSHCSHARPVLAFLHPRRPVLAFLHPRLHNYFIHALVRAGTCSHHAKHLSTDCPAKHSPAARDERSAALGKEQPPQPNAQKPPHLVSGTLRTSGFRNFAKRELKALVDYYGMELDTRPEPEPDDHGTLIWNVGDMHTPWPLRDPADHVHVTRLIKLLQDDEAPHEPIFDTYSKLPAPGVVYLDTPTIRALLHHLSVLERPTLVAAHRFLSILDDLKTAHIHISRSEWNTAIHLAGKAMGTVSPEELQSSLNMWRDMERRAGIKGSFVTFNILFTIAVRAGKYTLAEAFLEEMQARRLNIHRHHRVSLLYYYGILQDGNAVRKTYQDLVAAGDIVDTAVMNAVIAALFRAGEPTAAEHVFERMKRLHASKAAPAPGHKFFTRTWRQRRSLGLQLTHEALYLRKEGEKERLKDLQEYAPIAPDSRTYALLIRYQSSTVGNLARVFELLQEMRYNSVALEGTTYIVIFHGFNTFGGLRYSAWTRDKLEKVWMQYLTAIKEQHERTWLSKLAVVAALRAFSKVTDPDRTLLAWQELRKLWQPSETELEAVMGVLRRLVPSQNQAGVPDNFFST